MEKIKWRIEKCPFCGDFDIADTSIITGKPTISCNVCGKEWRKTRRSII